VSTFENDIEIQKTYPAVEYQPNVDEEPSGVWHEDHEIDGVMYRATNATFDDLESFKWSLVISSQPAYCITQNTAGSTSYLYMPANPENPQWLTSAWIGTGQPVIYHAVNYGLNVNDTVGTENAQALMNAINAAFAGSAAGGPGGIVFIPAGTYAISGPLAFVYDAETGQDSGIVIMGAGGSTELVQQDSGQPTFSFTGYTTGRGIRFKDLRITYVTAIAGTGAAIFVEDCQNVTCERVYFNIRAKGR
jgi:hypothetical protein